MAVISLNFYSKELKMSTTVTVVLPDSVRIGIFLYQNATAYIYCMDYLMIPVPA